MAALPADLSRFEITQLTPNFRAKLRQVLSMVLPELMVYLMGYYVVNVIYRFVSPTEDFTRVVTYVETQLRNTSRDLTFLLGFYVTTIAKRWWDQFSHIPEPDNLVIFLNAGHDRPMNNTFQWKRPILRHALLSWILCLRRFSVKLRQHYPDLASLCALGILTHDELTKLEDPQLWMRPLNWAANHVQR